MESFVYSDPVIFRPLEIIQDSQREIGFKVYPGALQLCHYLRENPLPTNSLVLELGSGVCALPSLHLAHAGCRAVATDMPGLVDMVSDNLSRNVDPAVASGSASVVPLTWGLEGNVDQVFVSLAAMCQQARAGTGDGTAAPAPSATSVAAEGCEIGSATLQQQRLHLLVRRPDVIIGADIVYHEPLIQPLLQTLLALTNPLPASLELSSPSTSAAVDDAYQSRQPPLVILSYVQRFKRAKQFFKLAKKHFEAVKQVHTGPVCDYDALTWTLPVAARWLAMTGNTTASVLMPVQGSGADGQGAPIAADSPAASNGSGARTASNHTVVITPTTAKYENYLRLLVEAAVAMEACKHRTDAAASDEAGAAAVGVSSSDIDAVGAVGNGDDDDDEWEEDLNPHLTPALDVPSTATAADGAFPLGGTSQVAASPAVLSSAPASAHAGDELDQRDDDADDSGEANGKAMPWSRDLLKQAKRAAKLLQIPFADPLDSYVYVLRRR